MRGACRWPLSGERQGRLQRPAGRRSRALLSPSSWRATPSPGCGKPDPVGRRPERWWLRGGDPSLGYGAAPGKYAILVQWFQQSDPAQSRGTGKPQVATIKGKRVVMTKHDKLEPRAPDRLKGRYSDAQKPLLQVEVKSGPNDLGTLELELKN